MTDWFVMQPERATAYGRPVVNGFEVRKGSTAMVSGSPTKKRDREERDRLVRIGVLDLQSDRDLYVFTRDYIFSSSSAAGGVVKDGNCSGPGAWRHETTGKTLRDCTLAASAR